jgi:hypothetical protein
VVAARARRQAVEELNRATGAGIDPDGDPGAAGQANTRGLMAAVSSLPELTERKRCIDKHTNLATHLLHVRRPAARRAAAPCCMRRPAGTGLWGGAPRFSGGARRGVAVLHLTCTDARAGLVRGRVRTTCRPRGQPVWVLGDACGALCAGVTRAGVN